ncbi:thioredoxin [Vulcanibacillus modesticaldus]|uniref:Thioredoxin n=1 Tax=Vulcanibacillus modesticaldus TaxID=337097 RepID=A0A1D2YUC5_9BACI|nr:thioredoxin [Vulcanibacillus modesticaldus]OEF99308.1 thioredoxin [Vulcanibacillus modesticaldus]
MAIVHVTDQSFATDVESTGTVIVDFWAPWCAPCKMIAPVLEEIDQEVGDKLKIAKLNVDENPASATKYGIMGIPTLLLFKDGKPVEKIVGFQPKEKLMATIGKYL